LVFLRTDSLAPGIGTPGAPLTRGRLWGEIALVLGLSLGASSIYSIVEIVDLSTRSKGLSGQTANLNTPLSARPNFDLIYQLLGLMVDVVPVVLVCYILWQATRPHLSRLGLDFRKPRFDILLGVVLAIVIGAGGLGVYLGARALHISADVSAESLNTYWWTVPVLLLSALRAALQEEFIVIGYLYARLRELGWKKWWVILATAAFRGSYHLYQGLGGFIGNFVMGVIFGWLYYRFGRLLPFVIAHFLIDAAIFIGYGWAQHAFPHLF
jgi:membrane protease YdiL (CAAX protease family)